MCNPLRRVKGERCHSYMSLLRCRQKKISNEYCSVKREVEEVMKMVGKKVSFGERENKLEGEQVRGTSNDISKKGEISLKSKTEKACVGQ